MAIKKKDFINRVLLIMNEVGMTDRDGNQLIGADSAQVDRYIEGSFVDSWRRCIKVMPRNWFKNKSFASQTLTPDLPNGTGYVILPDDFYLLTEFKMKGWQKSIYEASVENERTASINTNDWTRGSEIRPTGTIALIFKDNELKQALTYFSLPKGLDKHEVITAIYVPVPKSLNEMGIDDEIELNEQVIEPMAYLCAATVFVQFEKNDLAASLEARAIEMFPGLQSIKGQRITVRQ